MGHIGDSSSDTAQVAMGYSPPPEKPASGQPWSYPVDAVFIRRFGSLSDSMLAGIETMNTARTVNPTVCHQSVSLFVHSSSNE